MNRHAMTSGKIGDVVLEQSHVSHWDHQNGLGWDKYLYLKLMGLGF